VCAVGSGPDDIRADTRFATTSPDATLQQTLDFLRAEQRRHGPLTAVSIASFGAVDLRPGSATHGHITSTPPQPPGPQADDRCILLSNWDRLDDSLFWRVARELQAREVERIKSSDVKLHVSFWTDLKFVPTTWPPSEEELQHRVALVTIDVPNHIDQLSRLDQKRRSPKASPETVSRSRSNHR